MSQNHAMNSVEVKIQSSPSTVDLKPSYSFAQEDSSTVGVSAFPSFSSRDLSSMISAWVDQSNGDYIREMTISSGKSFNNIALQQHTQKRSHDQLSDPEKMLEAPVSKTSVPCFLNDQNDFLEKRPLKRTCEDFLKTHDLPRSMSLVCDGRNWPEFSRGAQELERAKKDLFTSTFNPLDYSANDLTVLVGEIFRSLELDRELHISWTIVQTFILSVRTAMPDNPYHNWTHVADVVQTVFAIAHEAGVISRLCRKQRLALFLAALCHDIEHPGVSASYLLRSRSNLATWFKNDPGLLEKHHSLRAFELLMCKSLGLLQNLATEDRINMRNLVRDIILATDMSRHAAFLDIVQHYPLDGEGESAMSPPLPSPSLVATSPVGVRPPRMLVLMQVLLKCADISNVVKPMVAAKEWAVAVTDEFFAQGDMERSIGIEVTPMCDRTTQSRVGLQKGFIDFVAGPFHRAVAQQLPGLAPLVLQMEENRLAWDNLTDEKLLLEVDANRRRRLPGATVSPADE